MKIGIYSPYIDTLAGGEKYMLTLAHVLSKEHTVSLFWNQSKDTSLQEIVNSKFNLDISAVQIVENIFDTQTSVLKRLKKTNGYDVIIALSDGSIPFTACKLILHFQSPMPWIKPSVKTKLKLQRVSKIICNSQYTKGYIDKEFGVTSSIIYPPVTINKKNIQKENIILHVGRFGITNAGSSAKKQEFMADTFKKMIDNGIQNWKLIFVISYKEQSKEAVEMFKKNIVGYPIELVENPTNDILWDMYNKAKIYWHASGYGEDLEKNPGNAEHFGISTVEAMGVGAVPVVIAAGGQVEIVENDKNGLTWKTQEEFIEKTTRVMHDQTLWQALSDQAQHRAQVYSSDHFSTAWGKVIL